MLNISRSKGNQTMKFGQLLEYNMRNSFCWKILPKIRWRIYSQTYFYKIEIENISGSMAKVLYSSFLLCANLKSIEIKWNQAGHHLHLPYIKLSPKKIRSGTSLLNSFSASFWKKNISLVISYQLTKFHCLVAFNWWDIKQYVYCNCLLTRLWRHKSRNQPYLFFSILNIYTLT